ncbi:MAG TPA: DUF2480 family protein [Phnomibacter sp.]|nr:DUF2480 family protein [Phnomibacter sp.]
MAEVFVNKVAESGIISLDLEALGGKYEWVAFDLKPFLFMELILREKEFREALKVHDWEVYRGKLVAVHCSADAIIPMWAYMLVGSSLEPYAAGVLFGDLAHARQEWLLQRVNELNREEFAGKRVVIKGCGDEPVSEAVYLAATVKLRPVVKSLMYGEPCSTVPIFKQKAPVA